RLGPEPLSRAFTAAGLAAALARRPGKIKSVLLDQRLIAGLGNIYVDEALFQARIHPERAANSLTDEEIRCLHRAIRDVLGAALARRGTSFSSYRDATGAAGNNQRFLNVYGRARGGRCPRCGGEIVKIIVGGRGTHFCPACQG
ncbi:MAG TPA: zinc finger domain-containing protein, partial [Thermomicrobiales bacterium]|nr:zinc finger domain-containing protein [Thermomicrobiales bacterium]